MKIVQVPAPVLNQQSKPVVNFDKRLQRLVADMTKTLIEQTDPPGVGLAAPQVGYSLRLFVIKENKKSPAKVFVNPNILKYVNSKPHNASASRDEQETVNETKQRKRKKKRVPLEGCLSIPKIWGEIKRDSKILLSYQTVDGLKKKEWFSGFEAVIIQHEIDHLEGILFTQRVLEQQNPLYEEKADELVKKEI